MTGKQQHSSDMVERVAAIISRVVYEHEAIEPAAREILEATHHSELVEMLSQLRAYPSVRAAIGQQFLAQLNAFLAKIGAS